MIKKIDKNHPIFQTVEFQKDKYKFFIALKILSDENSVIYSNEEDYIMMQMEKNLPIWIWTKDKIDESRIEEIPSTLHSYFDTSSKITCKKELYDLLVQKNKILDSEIFEMGTLYCKKPIIPKEITGTVELAERKDLEILSKYWYDDYLETEGRNYSLAQSKIDIENLLKEGNFYVLKDSNNKIVCMAKYSCLNNMARINKVYTPKEERRKGYCSNLIYHLSNKLLEQGTTPMLYTNYKYIPSNAAYKKVGYVEDGVLISFYLKEK